MTTLQQLYKHLSQQPGLQDLSFNTQDVQNATLSHMFQTPGAYDSDLEELEHELYLNKVYNTSLDTPVNQLSPELLGQILADRKYAFYVDHADEGLYPNGYIGDTPADKLDRMQKTPEYWQNFYSTVYK